MTRLSQNFRALRHYLSPDTRILSVVKADAYGHGSVLVARTLVEAGTDQLGVALAEEGVQLREAGISIPILVFGGCWPGQESLFLRHQLTPVASDMNSLQRLAAAAEAAGTQLAVHLEVDTGMGRLGVSPRDIVPFMEKARQLPSLRWEGLMTHFSCADDSREELTHQQLVRFTEVMRTLEERGLRFDIKHAANSAAILRFPASWFYMVRPGLLLYGYYPQNCAGDPLHVEPILQWKTRVALLKEVPAGVPLGYGGTSITARHSRIATLPVGYHDGLSRALSNQGQVLIRGRQAPLVGTISMDMALVDLTDFPDARAGDEVILLGTSGDFRITAWDHAAIRNTIPYEVLCNIHPRVPRLYV
ncbi:MAG: alanine racemase [Acidobacteria bacterium]|nr:alanine racemase [Acidobacteriota bacterium]